ncbi:MAG: DNA mismatch repair endonuclease MutL [Chloroherpetonaceae bacterium]|nr:DNA mismatch repair endonuclease MutL [Chloroherpetonaceae bacterium]MDW8438086.1 DNA mismatch repair endonuclease MutL [Chloroherpetonaceae bacterium]
MNLIKKLPDAIANKIAAGEVVQRPASAVKELLENAIDAGADEITLIVKDAGKTLIQVIDNGCGMSEADALLCFERFATSKISSPDDLENLHTLGFRGEALASIAAVAQVELKTKRRDEALASLVRIDGGAFQETSKTNAPDGTSIAVRNLFYNVPARRKFLKSDQTEFKHIYETIVAQALARPEIKWKFISDGEEVFNLATHSLAERLERFFGKDFSKGLIEFNEMNDFANLQGYLGKPAMMKRPKNEQFLFLNRRVVQSRQLHHAIMQGYGELLGEREQPFYLVYLEMEPRRFDVNIHPTKMEVRFEDERNLYNLLLSVVKRAVSGMDFSPSVKIEEKPIRFESDVARANGLHSPATSDFPGVQKRLRYDERESEFRSSNALYAEFKRETFGEPISKTPSPQNARSTESEPPSLLPVDEPPPRDEPQRRELELIFQSSEPESERALGAYPVQLHNRYILTQIKSGLMIIDQHVAHERILYERALAAMDAGISNSQQLLFPHRIEMKLWDMKILEDLRPDLERLGFSFRQFGANSVVVEGVPCDVKPGREERILYELIEQYLDYQQRLRLEKRDNIAKSFACRNAIMAGDKLSQREMSILIDQLFATSMPYVCPHGRPIVIKLSLAEFDKMFGRT